MPHFKMTTQVTYRRHEEITEVIEAPTLTSAIDLARARARHAAKNKTSEAETYVLGDTKAEKIVTE